MAETEEQGVPNEEQQQLFSSFGGPKDSQPDARTEETQAAVRTEDNQPAVRTEDTQAAVRTEDTQPAVRTEDTQAAVRTEDTQPDARTEETQAAARTEDTQAAVRTEDNQPAVRTEDTQAAVRTEDTQPAVRTEDTQAAVRTEETQAAVRTEDNQAAVRTEETQAAARTEDTQPAVRTEETQPAARTEDTQAAVRTEDIQAAVRTEDTQPAVRTEDNQAAVRTEDIQAAVRTEDTQPAVRTEDTQAAVRTEERAAEGAPARSQHSAMPVGSSPDEFKLRRFFVLRPGTLNQAIKDVEALVDKEVDGNVHSVWLMAELDHWNNEKERLVFITDSSLLVVKYDFVMFSCDQIQRIPLHFVDRISYGTFSFPKRSLLQREGEGVRVFWDRLREPSFISRWNPFATDFPFITFIYHPVRNISDAFAALCDIHNFRKQLKDVAQKNHAMKPVPGKANGVLVLNQPIYIETYVGLMSFLGNQNKLGYCMARGNIGF